MKKTKILFIHHGTGWGGAPNSLIKTINALDKNKYEAKVLLIKDSVVGNKLEANGIPYLVAKSKFYKKYYTFYVHMMPYYVPFYNIPKFLKLSIFWMLSRFYYAKRELQDIDFDIAHLNSSQITDWLAPCKAKGKVIMHIRESLTKGTFGFRFAVFKYQMRKYADKIIAISKDNARRVELPEKTEVIYNFSKVEAESINIDSYKSNKVLYLGGSQKIKGFYTIVNSLDYLNDDITVYFGGNYDSLNNSFKLRIKKIIGYGRSNRKAINKMRQNPRALEIGMVYDTSKYFNQTTCIVSPFSEPHFARPVIEAYLHKKAAIGTAIGGMDEIIENNRTGLLVKNNDGKALADAINYLASNPKISQEMGEYAYSVAIEKFTKRNIEYITKIYDNLI